MKRVLFFFLVFFISLWNGQTANSFSEPKLAESIQLLDQLMANNDAKMMDILCTDVSFGHSNGWVQNFEDFKRDFISQK